MSTWIWLQPDRFPDRQTCRCNTFVERPPEGQKFTVAQFSKTIDLPSPPVRVILHASADNAFDISVNNHHLWHGPTPMGGDWLPVGKDFPPFYMDSYDWTPDGSSTLAFLATVRLGPMRMNDLSRRRGGFMLEAEIIMEDGSRQTLSTDGSWLVRVLPGFSDPWHADMTVSPTFWRNAAVIHDVWNAVLSPLPICQEREIIPLHGNMTEVSSGMPLDSLVIFDKIYCGFPCFQTDFPCVITVEFFEDSHEKTFDKLIITLGNCGCFRALVPYSAGGFKINVRPTGGLVVHVRSTIIATSFPLPAQEGRFHCSDDNLNLVYDVCKWTLQICRQNMHLDSPKHQEPLACTGDYYIETLMTAFAYGDFRLVDFDIRRTAAMLQVNNGRLFHTTYSLIWVKWLWDTYLFTADRQLLEDCLPSLRLLLNRFRSYLGKNGIVENPPDFMFVDWLVVDGFSMHHPPKYLGQTVLNAFYHGALQTAAKIFSELNGSHDAEANQVLQEAAALKASCRRELFDSASRRFHDGLGSPSLETNEWLPQNEDKRHFSRHANVLAVLCGLIDGQEATTLLQQVLDSDLQEVQPYFMHYVLDAVWQQGLFDTYGIPLLKKWIPMVKNCSKGLQEGWFTPEKDYQFDYSHAWGGTPAYQLPARLLGFEMIEPGFRKFAIRPKLFGLSSATIDMPTPYGMIHCTMNENGTMDLSLPRELQNRCILRQ